LSHSLPPENRSFDQPKIGSEQSFGILFAAVFAIIGLWPLVGGGAARLWSLCLAALLLLLAVVAPGLLRPLNKLWFRFGLLLGKMATPIVIGFLFYLTVTPVALLIRLLRKDVLRLKRNTTALSYWLPRTPPGPERGSMRDQF
jgi:hypothetical protein